MSSILSLSENMYGKKSMVTVLYSTSKKWIEAKAESFHNEIEDINDALIEGKFTVHTVLSVNKKKSDYKLKVKIKFFKDEKKHEHKKNSHRQKVDI
tara:strand:+ start:186 stop:473 length:288 start_codon:yes stop_codon:yes gene_type:complete